MVVMIGTDFCFIYYITNDYKLSVYIHLVPTMTFEFSRKLFIKCIAITFRIMRQVLYIYHGSYELTYLDKRMGQADRWVCLNKLMSKSKTRGISFATEMKSLTFSAIVQQSVAA